jgi:hypothetical protein
VFAAERVHGDDTTVPVLASPKAITRRLWTYVRDDRPFGGAAHQRRSSATRATVAHPAVVRGYAGILQADVAECSRCDP